MNKPIDCYKGLRISLDWQLLKLHTSDWQDFLHQELSSYLMGITDFPDWNKPVIVVCLGLLPDNESSSFFKEIQDFIPQVVRELLGLKESEIVFVSRIKDTTLTRLEDDDNYPQVRLDLLESPPDGNPSFFYDFV